MSQKIALAPLDFLAFRSVIGGERTRHMTIALPAALSEPNPVSQPNAPLRARPDERRSTGLQHLVVQLTLTIEMPTNDIDDVRVSGAIVISLTPL